MVTGTTNRIPHAIQAGPTPTVIWLTLRLISLVLAIVPILLLPVAGRHLTWQNGVLVPDKSLLLGVLVACGVLIGLRIARRLLTSALAFRIPGQMGAVGPDGAPAQTTRVPGVVALIVLVAVEAAAVIYAATHAHGDHGVTALILTLAGIYFAVHLIAGVLGALAERRPGWQLDLGEVALRYAPSAVVLFLAGRRIAPRGELTEPDVALGVGLFLSVALLAAWLLRRTTRGGVMPGLAEELAEGVLSRTNAAPTLTDLRSGATRARVGICTAVVLAVGLCVVIVLV